MNAYSVVFIVALLLVGFAVYNKDSVRASFRIHSFWFLLEAKNNRENKKRRIEYPKTSDGASSCIESAKLENPRNL